MFKTWLSTKYFGFLKTLGFLKSKKRATSTEYILLFLVFFSIAFKFKVDVFNDVAEANRYQPGWIDSVEHPADTYSRNYGLDISHD